MNQKSHRVGHHKKSSQDILRSIISIITAFILSLSLLGLTILLVIQWSGFSRSSFYKNMSANNYYDNVQSDIQEEVEAITIPIGLPITVLDNVFTSYGISKDVNGYIDASFQGQTYTANVEKITIPLEENVRVYLEEAKIVPTQEQEANLSEYINSVVQIYTDTAQMPLLSYFVKARNLYNKVFMIGMIATILIGAICIYLIVKLHEWFHRGLRYVVYAISSTGLMSIIVPAYILKDGFYKRIHLSPEYFYNFFTDYVTNIVKSFLYFGIVWMVVSFIIICIIYLLKHSRNYSRR